MPGEARLRDQRLLFAARSVGTISRSGTMARTGIAT
jgi:hypothetical protein